MKRPIIGITSDSGDRPNRYEIPCAYSTAVEKAGGLPLIIPYRTDVSLIPQIVDLLDGIIFSGGNDLDPQLFGETRHPKAEAIDPDRQKFELALMAEVERRRMPALGICLGSQLMNVYRGGSLFQFLPDRDRDDVIEHRKLTDADPRHPVKLQPGTTVYDSLQKTDVLANSSHKQSVNKIGRGLRVIATSPDGVIEGIEDPSFPLFLGVQWHPERLHEEPDHLALFKLLVQRASHRETPVLTTPTVSIERNLLCIGCGYNLRGLPFGNRCPECGQPIRATLDAEVGPDLVSREVRALTLAPVAVFVGCKIDGVMFILDCVSYALQFARDENESVVHINARAVCDAVRAYSRRYFNDVAEAVDLLNEWGVDSSERVGKIVFALVAAGNVTMSPGESESDFAGLFTLATLFTNDDATRVS